MELGQQLKAHRKELGISQDELAEKIFVSRQSISNWETTKPIPISTRCAFGRDPSTSPWTSSLKEMWKK